MFMQRVRGPANTRRKYRQELSLVVSTGQMARDGYSTKLLHTNRGVARRPFNPRKSARTTQTHLNNE